VIDHIQGSHQRRLSSTIVWWWYNDAAAQQQNGSPPSLPCNVDSRTGSCTKAVPATAVTDWTPGNPTRKGSRPRCSQGLAFEEQRIFLRRPGAQLVSVAAQDGSILLWCSILNGNVAVEAGRAVPTSSRVIPANSIQLFRRSLASS
jgi:hypothetical protein